MPLADVAIAWDGLKMIDFEQVWLPQIVSYARLIDTGQLEDEWLGRSRQATSVTDPDELHEQVFDDLDADTIWHEVRRTRSVSTQLAHAIDCFLNALRKIGGNEPSTVVASNAWIEVREAANGVLAAVR